MSSAAAVTVYYSSVAGSVASKKKFEAIKQLLTAHKIAADMIDVSQAEFSAVRLLNTAATAVPLPCLPRTRTVASFNFLQ